MSLMQAIERYVEIQPPRVGMDHRPVLTMGRAKFGQLLDEMNDTRRRPFSGDWHAVVSLVWFRGDWEIRRLEDN